LTTSLTIPGTLKDVLVLTRLNKGGMANVFLGQTTAEPHRWLAIKTLLPELAQSSKFVSMFHNEGTLGQMLVHPHIVETYDVGRLGEGADALYYLVLGYVHGRDLGAVARHFRKANAPMPLAHVLTVAEQVLSGLDYAHARCDASGQPLHLVNRDVSPANIMVGFDGKARLIDFGIAQANLDFRSQIGAIRGKISYMSPEQVRGLPLDARSDLFSLSAVLYQLLTGVEPFAAETEAEQMELIRAYEPPRPREYDPSLPEALDEFLMKGLAKRASDRFHDAQDMREAVVALRERLGLAADVEAVGAFMREAFREDMELLQGRVDKARHILRERGVEVPPHRLLPHSETLGLDAFVDSEKVVMDVAALAGVETPPSAPQTDERAARVPDEGLRVPAWGGEPSLVGQLPPLPPGLLEPEEPPTVELLRPVVQAPQGARPAPSRGLWWVWVLAGCGVVIAGLLGVLAWRAWG
jgi:serine/threonine protein kinase